MSTLVKLVVGGIVVFVVVMFIRNNRKADVTQPCVGCGSNGEHIITVKEKANALAPLKSMTGMGFKKGML